MSVGASSDIDQANNIAQYMVTQLGMGGGGGNEAEDDFFRVAHDPKIPASQDSLKKIDQKIKNILRESGE